MKSRHAQLSICLALAALSLGGRRPSAAPHQPHAVPDTTAHARVVLSQKLPPLDGDHLAVTVVEVSYAPGGASTPHRHPCPVTGYIIEGSYRSRVGDGSDSVYTAGQSFYEPPNAVHAVSANASDTKPVRFLASFTCDRETPLSLAVPESHGAGTAKP